MSLFGGPKPGGASLFGGTTMITPQTGAQAAGFVPQKS